MKAIYQKYTLVLLIVFLIPSLGYSQFNRNRTVRVSATVNEATPSVTLNFQKFTDATTLRIFRKKKEDNNWGTVYANLSVLDSSYTDNDIKNGEAYEYIIVKEGGTAALGYIFSGINYAPNDLHGAIALVVDKTYVTDLATELKQLEFDLIGEGWQVVRIEVDRTDSVPIVKDKIKAVPNVKAALLFGHVPVPYSGNIVPDGHTNNHYGAWPCDGYYGDLDGTWSDNFAASSATNRDANKNVPGDGKFDQDKFSSDVDIQIGRIDLQNLTAFSDSDTELLRYYLQKNHAYRFGMLSAPRVAIIDDNFQKFTIASSTWRNFAPQVGEENIVYNTSGGFDYRTELQKDWKLWSGGAGAGSYNSCSNVIRTTQFASDSIKTIFTSLAGSYFGDWDSPNNLLRAALASKPGILCSFWGGIPNWVLHHMALGESIGYGTKLTQNESGTLYEGNFNGSQRSIHIALMGDPTLRMHTALPVASINATEKSTKRIEVTWTASPDSDIVGYHIYRAKSMYGVWGKVTNTIITGTSYLDVDPFQGNNVYMVRAIKKETSPSGTYYNYSQGVFDSLSVTFPANINWADKPLNVNVYPNPTTSALTIELSAFATDKLQGEISNVLGQTISTFNITQQNKTLDVSQLPSGIYFIKIQGDGYNGTTKFVKE